MTEKNKKIVKKITNTNKMSDNKANDKSERFDRINMPVELIRRYFEDLLAWALADRENVTFTRFRILRGIDDSTHNAWVAKYDWAKDYQEKTNEIFAENMAHCWSKRLFEKSFCERIIQEYDPKWKQIHAYHDEREIKKAIAVAKAKEQQQPTQVIIEVTKFGDKKNEQTPDSL